MDFLDFMMHRYHFSFHAARLFPLATAMLLARHVKDCQSDGTSPDNPVIAAMVRARALVRRFYAATHEITPNPEAAEN